MSATKSFSSILVGTDGSLTARSAVDEAIKLASEAGAKLIIVSAYAPVQTDPARAGESPKSDDAGWELSGRESVLALLNQQIASAQEAGVSDVQTFARQGDAADAIIDVAEEQGCDLIVVGNKGMTGARRFLLGSVPNKISHHAPCSVLIVRTTG